MKKLHYSGFFFMVLLLLCCAGNIFGQEILHLSPRDAVELAIRNNLNLQIARLTLDNKQRKADLVWNQFLPTISVSSTLAHSNWASAQPGFEAIATPPFISITSDPLPRWNLLGNFSASLDFSFALVAGIQTIIYDYHAGVATYERTRLQMERDIRKTYNQILLLEENVALLKESYDNAERQAAVAEANYRAGLVPRLTWLQAQVQVANLTPTITELENSLKALQASFAMTLGLPYDTQFALEPLLEGDFEIPMDLAELISRAASGRPDIIELQRNIVMLQSARKATALQLYTPFLRFQWTLSSTFNPTLDPWKNNWFKNANWRGGGNFSITLGYSLNTLFPFTTQGQGLQDLDNQLRSLYITMTQAVMGTELEIYTKVNSLQRTQATAEVQRAAVELAELSYSLTEEAYRAGLQDFQTVQNSALALRQARAQLLVQQFNYLNDLIDLEYAIGVPFGTLSSRY
ncbi:MAG: TolC family protein [Treponema sp.]|nr:TolC family protein [Treponema sp.]